MTPEQKCVSLETAKRLKAAGWGKETERDWCLVRSHSEARKPGRWCIASASEQYDMEEYGSNVFDERIAAPDAQELRAEMLSTKFEVETARNPYTNTWATAVKVDGELQDVFDDENEAEHSSAAWLWLKEQKLI
jgi:hypothetical protein